MHPKYQQQDQELGSIYDIIKIHIQNSNVTRNVGQCPT